MTRQFFISQSKAALDLAFQKQRNGQKCLARHQLSGRTSKPSCCPKWGISAGMFFTTDYMDHTDYTDGSIAGLGVGNAEVVPSV